MRQIVSTNYADNLMNYFHNNPKIIPNLAKSVILADYFYAYRKP